jgi:eukaryotic-like serine/threonine-protein kinase
MASPSRRTSVTYSAGTTERKKKAAKPPSVWMALLQLAVTLLVIYLVLQGFMFFWRATTPREVTIPKVVGLDQSAAQAMLHNSGLEYEIVSQQPSDTVAANKVISAVPEGDRVVKQGRKIRLVVSLGSKWTVVPDVRDMSERRALDRLANKALQVGQVKTIYHARLTKGFIIEQMPAPAARVAKNTKVNLIISLGRRPKPGEEPPAEDPNANELDPNASDQ